MSRYKHADLLRNYERLNVESGATWLEGAARRYKVPGLAPGSGYQALGGDEAQAHVMPKCPEGSRWMQRGSRCVPVKVGTCVPPMYWSTAKGECVMQEEAQPMPGTPATPATPDSDGIPLTWLVGIAAAAGYLLFG